MALQHLSVVRRATSAGLLLAENRRRLVEALTAEPDSAAGLARRFAMPRQRINYHLNLLEREGLVEEVERRRKGNCVERILRATAKAFVISPETLGALGAPTSAEGSDRASAAALIGTAARAIEDVARLDARAKALGKRLATLTLDAEVRFASAADRAEFMSDLVALVGRLVAKYHDEVTPRGRAFRLITLVHPVQPKEDRVDG